MNNILTELRRIFGLGIQEMPGYKHGDKVGMAIGTTKEIDNLPETTEREGQQ